MDSNNTTNTSSRTVTTPNSVGTIPSKNVQKQSTKTIPPMQHHKGKSMTWMILLLLFVFVGGLALAVWYFQTQSQKLSANIIPFSSVSSAIYSA